MNILSYTPDELRELMTSIGEPAYRSKQIFTQLHRGISPDEMTNIPKKLKETLLQCACYPLPTVEKKLTSALDGTVKYLMGLYDGNCVEAVVMKYNHGNTICISSQVGCRMGCRFCASTIGGRVRDLLPSELLGQIIVAERDMGERIGGVVMMGIGEPLDNFDNVIKFLELVGDEKGLNIGYRHISLSTCGLVPRIKELAELNFPITLSISLHAPDDETRSKIMPVNNSYGVDELLSACKAYFVKTNRRISFEYTMIRGVNDTDEDARQLAELLRGMISHVNLIPLNPVDGSLYTQSDDRAIRTFQKKLTDLHVNATIRRRLGQDISAACGQLRNENR